MEYAFWDSSSLVSLCVQQQRNPVIQALSAQFHIVAWWQAPVEMRSAFTRLLRMGQLTPNSHVQAQVALEQLRSSWREIRPSDELREQAERLIDRFPLKTADAFQLAAAYVWCSGKPQSRVFLSGDNQLLDAARQLGFQVIEA